MGGRSDDRGSGPTADWYLEEFLTYRKVRTFTVMKIVVREDKSYSKMPRVPNQYHCDNP
jgi:hypothetical protein